jgi:anti-sigma regulatory factor (Ser/Thr protein kinase)
MDQPGFGQGAPGTSQSMQRFELTLDARPESLAVVRHVLGAIPGFWAADHETFDDMLVAVNEACSNVVVHAYADSEGLMEVCGELDGERLTIAVSDRGEGVSHAENISDHGVGLALIDTLADEVTIGTRADGGHEVQMTFVPGSSDD